MSVNPKLYWLSWYQPTDDYRPLHYPPTAAVLGWWCSGEADEGATLCALVIASDETAAKAAIKADWPEASRWRFCDERSHVKLSDRFPVSGWMSERIAAAERMVEQAP